MTVSKKAIPLSDVRPFYQVVVFADPSLREFNLRKQLERAAAARLRKDSRFELMSAETDKALQYVHVKHTSAPPWVRPPSKVTNVEHDEAMLYRTGPFVFVHSSCRPLLDLLVKQFEKDLARLPAGEVEKVLARRASEIRALGMQNLNAPGRTAPEGKIHFARDAASTLSPVRDAMYGFRHAFAVERRQGDNKARPFGCSGPKRKIWGTWVDTASHFTSECDRLAADLGAPDTTGRRWVLAAAVAQPPPNTVPIGFYADYVLDDKGTIWLDDGAGGFSADWTCHLNGVDAVRFEIRKHDSSLLSFDLSIIQNTTAITLAYPAGAAPRSAKSCDDEGELEHRRSRDFVDLLNDEESFTVVLTNSLSYRSGQFWRNNSLGDVFSAARTEMDWSGIDLSAESLASGRNDTIGDGILRHLKNEGWPKLVICDDGANEVADFLALGTGRIALIHAKFSSKPTPGLRVDDLQVLLAQSLKNLQFFQWAFLERHLARLLRKIRPEFSGLANPEQLLRETYENQRAVRECWVVQPGISAAALTAAPKNKIHALLNHAEAACMPGNVEFRLFCSP